MSPQSSATEPIRPSAPTATLALPPALLHGGAPPACVLVVGPAGSGKTQILHTLAGQLRSAGRSVGYHPTTDAVEWIVADDAELLAPDAVTRLVGAVESGRASILVAAQQRAHDPRVCALHALAQRSMTVYAQRPLTTPEVRERAAGLDLPLAVIAGIRRRTLGVAPVIDDVIDGVRSGRIPADAAAAAADEAATAWQHRQLRRLDGLARSVLVLAALRRPLDTDTLCALLDESPDAVVAAIDRAHGSGLLSASGVVPGVIMDALRDVAGSARFAELRRSALVFALQGEVISVDDALAAMESGIPDTRLFDVLVTATHAAAAGTVGPLLAAAARAAASPAQLLEVARLALSVRDLDTAAAVTDDLLIRASTDSGTDSGTVDLVGVVETAAATRWANSHTVAGATVVDWLRHTTGSVGGATAAVVRLAVGAGVAPPTGAAAIPTGDNVAVQAIRDALAASLTASPDTAADDLARAVSTFPTDHTGSTPLILGWTATTLALHAHDYELARHLAARTDSASLCRWVSLLSGGADVGADVGTIASRVRTPRETHLDAVSDLAAARRCDDADALQRAWQQLRRLPSVGNVDLLDLLPLGEIVSAAAQLGELDRVRPWLEAADRLLAGYNNPPAWTTAWRTYTAPPADSTAAMSDDGPLTDREAEVARELLAGYTYREIGERLFISAKTVEHHVARIRRRLDAGSRSELLGALRAAGYS